MCLQGIITEFKSLVLFWLNPGKNSPGFRLTQDDLPHPQQEQGKKSQPMNATVLAFFRERRHGAYLQKV